MINILNTSDTDYIIERIKDNNYNKVYHSNFFEEYVKYTDRGVFRNHIFQYDFIISIYNQKVMSILCKNIFSSSSRHMIELIYVDNFDQGNNNHFENIFKEINDTFDENISIICHVDEKEYDFINYLKSNSFRMLGIVNIKSTKLITYIFDGNN